MPAPIEPQTTTISVFTRHSAECPKTDPQWKRCTCRKSLYIYEDGKVSYKSAKTRSWEQAEKIADAERAHRDPVKRALKAIEEAEAAKVALATNRVTVSAALDRWLASLKISNSATLKLYIIVIRKINAWATEQGITHLSQVTSDALDTWRGEWSPAATRKYDRMATTTQSQFQTRLKAFFGWALKLDLIERDPSVVMDSIKTDARQTIPLSSSQFSELLAATDTYDADPDREVLHEGHLLKTLFLLMRWSGLRIGDCLTMARASLKGNSLDLITRKTKAHYRGTLPDEVAGLLRALPQGPGTHPDYFFWSVDSTYGTLSTYETLTSSWTRAIRDLNRYMRFRDDHGRPVRFHSHMLRDTFAVELLLAGVALEDVSRLLTHKSVRITEKYYAPWIVARQTQLADKLLVAMRKMGATVSTTTTT